MRGLDPDDDGSSAFDIASTAIAGRAKPRAPDRGWRSECSAHPLSGSHFFRGRTLHRRPHRVSDPDVRVRAWLRGDRQEGHDRFTGRVTDSPATCNARQ